MAGMQEVGKSEALYGGVAARGRASQEGAITPVKWIAHRSDQLYRVLHLPLCISVAPLFRLSTIKAFIEAS